jgi:methylmalonyl-CoA mutase cobalamin-binding subunit
VLIAGLAGDPHALGMQMVHDQLAAAGFRTTMETDLSVEVLLALVDGSHPDVLVVGPEDARKESVIAAVLEGARRRRPDLPIVLSGPAVGGELPDEHWDAVVLERIDETVSAVEGALSPVVSTASV